MRLSEPECGTPRIQTLVSVFSPLPWGSQTIFKDMLMDVFNFNSFVLIWAIMLQPLPHVNARPTRTGIPVCFFLTAFPET